MEDKQRELHERALTQALEDLAQLQQVIAYHRQKLGQSTPVTADAKSAPNAAAGPGSDPLGLVSEGEFYGMSNTKAARAILEKVGRTRPLKTEEILAAITKGGVALGGKNPQGTLYKMLDRVPTVFHKVGKGRWGLTIWYPASKTTGKSVIEYDEESLDEATDP